MVSSSDPSLATLARLSLLRAQSDLGTGTLLPAVLKELAADHPRVLVLGARLCSYHSAGPFELRCGWGEFS